MKKIFESILNRYPGEYKRNKLTSNPYFKEFRDEISNGFKDYEATYGVKIHASTGAGNMPEQPYVTFLSLGQKTSKGIYPYYTFDFDNDRVIFAFGDSHKNPPPKELLSEIEKENLTAKLKNRGFYLKKNDIYPEKEYSLDEVDDTKLKDDLDAVLGIYQNLSEKFEPQIKSFLAKKGKDSFEEILDKFFEWYKGSSFEGRPNDPEYSNLSKSFLENLSDSEFVKFFYNFAHKGGKLQSGGSRNSNRFKKHVESNLNAFKAHVLSVFSSNFDLNSWWKEADGFLYWGNGIRSIYLFRCFPNKYPVYNDKSKTCLLDFDLIKRKGKVDYPDIVEGIAALIEKSGGRLDLNSADAFCHFYISVYKDSTRTWLLSSGTSGEFANDFLDNNYIGIGYRELDLGDLSNYKSKASLQAAIEKNSEGNSRLTHTKKSIFDFANTMSVGDLVILKEGTTKIHGLGKIESDYYYDESTDDYKHRRDINWILKGDWSLTDIKLRGKTLTDYTKKSADLTKIFEAIGYKTSDGSALKDLLCNKIGLSKSQFSNITDLSKTTVNKLGIHSIEDSKFAVITLKRSALRLHSGNWLIFSIKKNEAIVIKIYEEGDENKYHLDETEKRFTFVDKIDGKEFCLLRISTDELFENFETYRHIYLDALSLIKSREHRVPKKNSEDREIAMEILSLAGRKAGQTQTELSAISKNLIFYGPPGTGKTYKLKNELFDKFSDSASEQTKEEYLESIIGNHPWWVIVAAALLDMGRTKVSKLKEHELLRAKERISNTNSYSQNIWGHLQTHTVTDCSNVKYERRKEPLFAYKNEDSSWEIKDKAILEEAVPEALELIGLAKNFNPTSEKVERFKFVTFHQSFSYEDFIEGIKPVTDSDDGELRYEVVDGIFKEMCRKARQSPEKDFAIFIDEINRGNIAAIFGELITLIEEDKREGEANALSVVLPYSKEKFSVPKNLYLIGTMNTADRSVEALDAALRRRFSFVECLPDASFFESENLTCGDINLSRMLSTMNRRLERLIDGDHTIGHAYFMPLKDTPTIETLQAIIKNKIIPLLKEFFFGDFGRIGLVLGSRFVTQRTEDSIFPSVFEHEAKADFEERQIFEIKDPSELTETDFISIYDDSLLVQ